MVGCHFYEVCQLDVLASTSVTWLCWCTCLCFVFIAFANFMNLSRAFPFSFFLPFCFISPACSFSYQRKKVKLTAIDFFFFSSFFFLLPLLTVSSLFRRSTPNTSRAFFFFFDKANSPLTVLSDLK